MQLLPSQVTFRVFALNAEHPRCHDKMTPFLPESPQRCVALPHRVRQIVAPATRYEGLSRPSFEMEFSLSQDLLRLALSLNDAQQVAVGRLESLFRQ